jgi:hypothetical protein
MGSKKKKRQAGASGADTTTRSTTTAVLEPSGRQQTFIEELFTGWGSKYGNPGRVAQKPVAAVPPKGLELPNPEPLQGRTPTTESSHFPPPK